MGRKYRLAKLLRTSSGNRSGELSWRLPISLQPALAAKGSCSQNAFNRIVFVFFESTWPFLSILTIERHTR